MKTISIVIPLYNEESGIEFLINELNSFFEEPKGFSPEVIFVNDGSSDRTCEKLILAKHLNYKARICSLSKNFGSHAALRAGILHATGDFICFLYADLQDPISLIPQMYRETEKGSEIVWAKRSKVEVAFIDKKLSQLYAWLMRKYVSKLFPEQGFDVFLFSRKVADELNRNVEGNSSIFLHILMLGFDQSYIEYEKANRKHGVSKWTFSKKIKLIVDSFVSFSFAPIRFVSIMGLILFIVGICWTLYIVGRKIIYDDLSSGWPTLFSTLLMGFGLTNISLGIIAEYIWRTLDASRKRPVFIIEKVVELN